MTVAGELVKELLRMIEDEMESGNLVKVRRARAPSLILPFPTHPALLSRHSRSLGLACHTREASRNRNNCKSGTVYLPRSRLAFRVP